MSSDPGKEVKSKETNLYSDVTTGRYSSNEALLFLSLDTLLRLTINDKITFKLLISSCIANTHAVTCVFMSAHVVHEVILVHKETPFFSPLHTRPRTGSVRQRSHGHVRSCAETRRNEMTTFIFSLSFSVLTRTRGDGHTPLCARPPCRPRSVFIHPPCPPSFSPRTLSLPPSLSPFLSAGNRRKGDAPAGCVFPAAGLVHREKEEEDSASGSRVCSFGVIFHTDLHLSRCANVFFFIIYLFPRKRQTEQAADET